MKSSAQRYQTKVLIQEQAKQIEQKDKKIEKLEKDIRKRDRKHQRDIRKKDLLIQRLTNELNTLARNCFNASPIEEQKHKTLPNGS